MNFSPQARRADAMHTLRHEHIAPQHDEPATVTFTLNGRVTSAGANETLLQVAQREGLDIPHLCYTSGLAPAGNCRSCVVQVDGERTLAASCCRQPANGMSVTTHDERTVRARNMVLELLQSDMP